MAMIKKENRLKVVTTSEAPAAIGPYSQGISAGNLLFVSGQIPLDPATGDMVKGGMEEKTHQVLKNLKGVVEAAGATLGHVVKTTIFLVDLNHFLTVNKIYAEYFSGVFPARSTVQVSALPKGADIEIEAIVHLPG
jgi:2-iminobutanoate/2-iminopropanoate deaminase